MKDLLTKFPDVSGFSDYLPFLLIALVVIALLVKKKSKKKSKGLKGRRVAVLNTNHARFMSCLWFRGQPAAGTYNLNKGGVDVYAEGKRRHLPSVGESVYALTRINNTLVAACENAHGKAFNAVTGTVYGPIGLHSTIKVIKAFGRVVTISSNWDKKQAAVQEHGKKRQGLPGEIFIRDAIVFSNKLHILGFDYGSQTGGMFISKAGASTGFTWYPLWKNKRPMKVVTYEGKLAITYSTWHGQRVAPAGIMSYKSGKTKVLHITTEQTVGFAIAARKDALYYGTLNWNGGGNASVWTNQSGKWKKLVQFNQHECLDLSIGDKGLLAATGGAGQKGVVYLIT